MEFFQRQATVQPTSQSQTHLQTPAQVRMSRRFERALKNQRRILAQKKSLLARIVALNEKYGIEHHQPLSLKNNLKFIRLQKDIMEKKFRAWIDSKMSDMVDKLLDNS